MIARLALAFLSANGSTWVLLSCGCQVQLHGNAKRPTWCPDHGKLSK
jgi:hypothetical protein